MKQTIVVISTLLTGVVAYTPCAVQEEFDKVMCRSATCKLCPDSPPSKTRDWCVKKCIGFQELYNKCRCRDWPCSRRCFDDRACPNDEDLVPCVDPTTTPPPPPPEELEKELKKAEQQAMQALEAKRKLEKEAAELKALQEAEAKAEAEKAAAKKAAAEAKAAKDKAAAKAAAKALEEARLEEEAAAAARKKQEKAAAAAKKKLEEEAEEARKAIEVLEEEAEEIAEEDDEMDEDGDGDGDEDEDDEWECMWCDEFDEGNNFEGDDDDWGGEDMVFEFLAKKPKMSRKELAKFGRWARKHNKHLKLKNLHKLRGKKTTLVL